MKEEKPKQKQDYTTHLLIIVAIVMFTIGLVIFSAWSPYVSGTRRWETYTGTITGFHIDCSQCCHASSGFSISTQNGIIHENIVDCDENLMHLIHVGQNYTIHLEPFAEQYSISPKFGEPTSYWTVQIDWIKDAHGTVIYGSEWF